MSHGLEIATQFLGVLVITSLAQQVRKQDEAISGYQVPIIQVQTLYLTSAKIVRFLQIRLLPQKKRARYLQRSFQQGEQRSDPSE